MKTIENISKVDINLNKILESELIIAHHIKEVKNDDNVKLETEDNKIPENVTTNVIKTNVVERFTNSYKSVKIKNESGFDLTEEIVEPNVTIEKPKKVLIFHTHTCESYTPSEKYQYEMTGNYRTTDKLYNVVEVGEVLSQHLQKEGFEVIHDTTYHDYPAYSGSYERSYATVQNILKDNNDIEILFDLHRDSIGDSSYAPTVKIGDEYAAQIMFVIGTNGGGLDHPNWHQNLKTAIKIQEKANEKYPRAF